MYGGGGIRRPMPIGPMMGAGDMNGQMPMNRMGGMGGALGQNPQMMAWAGQLANRRRDIDAAVAAPTAQQAQQSKLSRVAQDEQGNWYYQGNSGEWIKTSVIQNPQTGMRFYWDNDARDYVPAE